MTPFMSSAEAPWNLRTGLYLDHFLGDISAFPDGMLLSQTLVSIAEFSKTPGHHRISHLSRELSRSR